MILALFTGNIYNSFVYFICLKLFFLSFVVKLIHAVFRSGYFKNALTVHQKEQNESLIDDDANQTQTPTGHHTAKDTESIYVTALKSRQKRIKHFYEINDSGKERSTTPFTNGDDQYDDRESSNHSRRYFTSLNNAF